MTKSQPFLPTKKICPLPGRPLGIHDLIMEAVNYEDQLMPHIEYLQSPEEINSNAPQVPDTPVARNMWRNQIVRFAHSMMP